MAKKAVSDLSVQSLAAAGIDRIYGASDDPTNLKEAISVTDSKYKAVRSATRSLAARFMR